MTCLFCGDLSLRSPPEMLIAIILPLSTIITFPGKMPAIISLSCTGICGEEDFRCGDRGTPGCRREWQGSFRPRRLEMLWIWKVLGSVISCGSGQILGSLSLPGSLPGEVSLGEGPEVNAPYASHLDFGIQIIVTSTLITL